MFFNSTVSTFFLEPWGDQRSEEESFSIFFSSRKQISDHHGIEKLEVERTASSNLASTRMNWIRTDCYEPGGSQEEGDCSSMPRKRCPLHKSIRNRQWSEVTRLYREEPSRLCNINGHGWSSLTLALYHMAPVDLISEMLSLLSPEEQTTLLSTPVPNGSRLCLHFAARYSDSLDVIKLLVEAYPPALLAASDDGVTPLERAVYYRKDAEILHYLEGATKTHQDLVTLREYNRQLRYTILMACERSRNDNHSCCILGGHADRSCLTLELYEYCKEREMIGLFWNVLDFIGVDSVP